MLKTSKYFLFEIILLILSLAACQTQIPVATITPTAMEINLSTKNISELVEILHMSDPALPQYYPTSSAYEAFPKVVETLSEMNSNATDAASDLAVAIRYPRSDSYLAAQALLKLGPEITSTTIPILIDNLHNQNLQARIYSVILIGSVEEKASCAADDIAPLLWDSNSRVRTAAALALENVTAENLIASDYEVAITPDFLMDSLPEDMPDGQVISTARTWWNEKGSKVNWHPSYGICDP